MSDIDLKALRERFCCLERAIRDTGVERKAFEAWAIERRFDITPDNQCGYESEKTLGAWRAWGVTPSEDVRLALSLLDRLEAAERRAEEAEKERDAPSLAVTLTRTLGMYGAAFDGPGAHRAYTYQEQPGNTAAHRLGNAVHAAMDMRAGDSIDRGLGLLKALQDVGFGVFQIDAPPPATVSDGGAAK